MATESNHSNGIARVGIVVGGGPAPGINGTIGAVTLEAGTRGRGARQKRYPYCVALRRAGRRY